MNQCSDDRKHVIHHQGRCVATTDNVNSHSLQVTRVSGCGSQPYSTYCRGQSSFYRIDQTYYPISKILVSILTDVRCVALCKGQTTTLSPVGLDSSEAGSGREFITVRPQKRHPSTASWRFKSAIQSADHLDCQVMHRIIVSTAVAKA
jgi:hypothetical protein